MILGYLVSHIHLRTLEADIMFHSLVFVFSLWIESAKSHDIDLEGSIMHTVRTRYLSQGDDLRNVYFQRTDEDTAWPKHFPSMKIHKANVVYEDARTFKTTSVTALDQWYENHQKHNPLKVKLSRKVELSRTTSTQILRGVRSTLKADLSLSFPNLGGSGSSLGAKAGVGVSVAIDARERTTTTNTTKETFTINQDITVKAQTTTHVLWVIIEKSMGITWTATLYLEGYVMSWYVEKQSRWKQQFINVCTLADPTMNDIERVNTTSCKVTVAGFTKVEGGMESHVITKDKSLRRVESST